jgi:predicted  nucleic acid-binding Zn-ribbon protein
METLQQKLETLMDARRNIDKLIRKVKSEMFFERISDNFTEHEIESQRMQEFISQLIEE